MFRLRQQNRLNRILVLALALLISNVAALSCAMAYALCTDCPEHPPIVCVEPCVESNALIADRSPDGSTDAFRPLAFLPALAAVDPSNTGSTGPTATDDLSCEIPSRPLRLRFCVFLK